MKNIIKQTMIAAATVMALSSASTALADNYPSKTITMICSHGAGGDTDYNARLISRLLEKELGVSVVVSNVTGANGSIALTQYKDAKPDGYTLIATNTVSMASNEASGISDFGYDAFEPVAIYGKQCGENIIVQSSAPYADLNGLIEATKKDPEKIKLGVAMGGSSYIAALVMMLDKDAKFAMVDAGGDASGRMTSLLGGHIDATIAPYSLAKEYIEAGKVRSLATLMSEKLPATPDIPTAKELGLENLTVDTMYGIFAPKGTDPAIVEKLNAAVLKIVNNDQEYKDTIKSFNYQDPYALNVKDTIERLKAQREHFMTFSKYLQ